MDMLQYSDSNAAVAYGLHSACGAVRRYAVVTARAQNDPTIARYEVPLQRQSEVLCGHPGPGAA